MLGLHANTVRPRLDRIREAGLLAVTTNGRGEVGRPQHRFSLAADTPSLGLEPPTTPVLARMVLEMAERLSAERRRRVRRRSRPRVEPVPSTTPRAPSALEALVDDLDRLGFDPVVAESDTPDNAIVAFANCPFAAYAETIRISSANSTAASSPGSSPRWATPRSPSSARSPPHAMPGGGDQPLALTEQPPGGTTVITLTETAAVKVKELLAAEGADDLACRVAVRPGGCSGFSYEMFFDGDIAADDEQATFGPDARQGRRRPGLGPAAAGATLDYKDGLDQSGFAITNPNATRTCGCGQGSPDRAEPRPA